MTNFTDGETLTAADLNAAFASVTPNNSDLLGGTGTVFVPITVGDGLVLNSSTLSANTGTVTKVATTGAGITGGPIDTIGTLAVEWNAGTVAAVGAGLALTSNTLGVQWSGGTVTALGTGVSLVGGTISATGSGGSVTSVVGGAGLTGGTITTTGTLAVDYAATGTPTLRTQPDRAGEDYINVMDYGAVLDGVTNDSAAFNEAYTLATTDASIWVPRGAVHRVTGLPSRSSGNVLWKLDGDTIDATDTTLNGLGDGDLTETFDSGVKSFRKVLVAAPAALAVRVAIDNGSTNAVGQSSALSATAVLRSGAAGNMANVVANSVRQSTTASVMEQYVAQQIDETGQTPVSGQGDYGYEARLIANCAEVATTEFNPGTGARSLILVHGSALLSTTTWAATTAYVLNQIVTQTAFPNAQFICTVAGTSGSTEPAWSASGPTTDGSVTWVSTGAITTFGWRPSHAFLVGAPTQPVPPNGFTYVCTIAGTTAASQPVWPVSAGTVSDGSVTWSFSGTVSMQAAAAIQITSASTAEFAAAIFATGPFYDAILEFSGASLADSGVSDAGIRLASNMPIDFSGDLTAAHQNIRTLRYNSSNTALEYVTGVHKALSVADTGITDFPLTPTVLGVPLGGGSVTSVVAGSGLNGGTITSSGTISLGTIAATSLLGNAGTVTAVPAAVSIGSGLSLATNGTLSATGSGGSVTSVVTNASPYLNAGTITSAGTITASTIAASSIIANATTAGAVPTGVPIGTGLAFSSGTLTASSGSVTSVVSGAGLHAGTITTAGTLLADWNGGTVAALATGLAISSTTLTPQWQAGSATALGGALAINSGTISPQNQGTITLSGTTTGTINPSGIDSCIVNIGTANGTIAVSPGFQGQRLRTEIKQGATAQTVTFTSTVSFGTTVTSYTATASASARDLIQLFCVDGTHWAFAAVSQGFTI